MAALGLTGIGHVALKVADITRSLAFYRDRLGFEEMMHLDHDDGSLWLVYLRITDTQFLELFPGGEDAAAPGPDRTGRQPFLSRNRRYRSNGQRIARRRNSPHGGTQDGAGWKYAMLDRRPRREPHRVHANGAAEHAGSGNTAIERPGMTG